MRILLVLLLVSLGANAQSMYKWVDEKGRTVFSETPPPDNVKGATKIEVKTQQPDKPPADDWREREQLSRERRAKQGMETEIARRKEEAERPRLCSNAKTRYDQLNSRRAIYRLDSKGDRVYVDEKERAAEIEAAKADIARYCS